MGVRHGSVEIERVDLPWLESGATIQIGEDRVEASIGDGHATFARRQVIDVGDAMTITQ